MFDAGDLEDVGFTINESYAKRFEYNKKREDLHRLQEKYGKNVADDETTSSGSEEDEDAMHDSIAKDKGFLRVLSKLKSKDPAIYDKNKYWFEDTEGGGRDEVREKKEKPVYLKDYERETLLTKGSLVIDSDEEDPPVPTYTQEQEKLKEDLKSALNFAVDEEKPVLTLRAKSEHDKEKENEDYRQWLKGEKSKIKDSDLRTDCDYLKKAWSDPTLDENEKFLRDFILNKGWVEKDEIVPTYDDIINDEEEELEKHETFERQFNFRFEEPGNELIRNYPRTIANSVRKKDDSRKEKRKRKQEKKLKEKEERKQEIERLKKLKFDEIESKIQKLSDNAGTDLRPALHNCLDKDFNPDEHDKVMSELFDDDYYEEEDFKKPVFSDSDDDLINDEEWFNKITERQNSEAPTDKGGSEAQGAEEEKGAEEEEGDEETNIIYPGDSNKGEDEEGERTRKKSWKRKRSKKFKEAVIKTKPTFNPDEGPFERFFDEYYKLDCEDVIGDVKCRFGYRKTKRSSYGLTIDEILMADDKELNQWYSFKKMMKYRTPGQEAKDQKKFLNKRHNDFMKRQILKSLYPDENAAADNPEPSPTVTGNRKKTKKKKTTETPNESTTPSTSTGTDSTKIIAVVSQDNTSNSYLKKNKEKKRKNQNASSNGTTDGSPKKKKKKTKPASNNSKSLPDSISQIDKKKRKSQNISQSRLEAYGLS